MDIKAMQKEVYDWAVTKGWEPDSNRTFGDECALLHSEISEALEAYRIWKFDDATEEAAPREEDGTFTHDGLQKPEGVASELADVLIRLLHYSAAGRFSFVDSQSQSMTRYRGPMQPVTFGDECALMSYDISKALEAYYCTGSDDRPPDHLWRVDVYMSHLLYRLQQYATDHGFNLLWEYRRKMDYNRTRAYRHGNRTM